MGAVDGDPRLACRTPNAIADDVLRQRRAIGSAYDPPTPEMKMRSDDIGMP
jgi:hypothetical protein